MRNFHQFLSDKINTLAINSIVRNLLEARIDPVEYVNLRLVEKFGPGQAATNAAMPGGTPGPGTPGGSPPAGGTLAPANNTPTPNQDKGGDPMAVIKQMTDAINQLLQAHGQSGNKNFTKQLTDLAAEVQKLTAAWNQDQQGQQQQPAPTPQKIGNSGQQMQQMPSDGLPTPPMPGQA